MTLVLPFILHGRPGVVQRPPEGGVLRAPQRLHDAEREHRMRHDPRACPDRTPPLAVKRPARPYKSPIQYRHLISEHNDSIMVF